MIISGPNKAIARITVSFAALKWADEGPKGGVAGGKNYPMVARAADARDTLALSHASNTRSIDVE